MSGTVRQVSTMNKVKNKKALRRLAIRKLLAEKNKNLIAVFAVVLTAVLFTAVFTIGNFMIQSAQESTMRQVGGSAHAGVKFCLPEEVEKLSKDSAVKSWGTRLFVGAAYNEELLKVPSEIGCVDENYAKFSFCEPTTGTLPVNYEDCAVSTLVLDAMGLPHELGVKLPLKFEINGEMVTEEFTVCGFFEGDIVSSAQMIFISRAWCDKNVPVPEKPYYDNDADKYNICGYTSFDFFYDSSYDIEQKTVELLIRNGYDPNIMPYGVNWAYGASSVDMTTVFLIVGLLLLIIISGYLIIYNIFYIRISSDIRSYGLLKTIGTTGRQLKKVVYIQAFFISAVSIPVGLLIGYLVGTKLSPFIIDNFAMKAGTHISANPWIFLGAGVFTLVTVWVSCIRPCRMAARVSPIEAVRYVENSAMKIKAKTKKSRKVTALSMAWGNIRRTPKKVMLVVISVSLSLIMLNAVYSVIAGFDMDKFMENRIIGDFIVKDATVQNVYAQSRDTTAMNDEIIKELEDSGLAFTHEEIFFSLTWNKISDTAYDRALKFMNAEEFAWLFSEEYGSYTMEKFQNDHEIEFYNYGISEWTFDKLEPIEGTIDYEKFMTGNYCIMSGFMMSENEEYKCYDIGEKVSVTFPDGTSKEYEVMAIAGMKYALSMQSYGTLAVEMILPQKEYVEHFCPEGAMLSVLNMNDSSDVAVMEEWISDYTTTKRMYLDYTSRKMYEGEFEQLKFTVAVVGGLLSFILALIGILNFINSIVTGILSRQREFAMMEAVGMTGKQLRSMLAWEGVLYAAFASVMVLTVGMAFCNFIVEAFAGQMWFFAGHFEILPVAVCIPVLAAVSFVVPVIAYKKMIKESVVERLRGQE